MVADPPVADTPSSTEAPAGSPSLSTMLLPELRAIANSVGVKSTSGRRKIKVIAAIRERQGESNGRTHHGEAVDTVATDTGAAPSDAVQATEAAKATDTVAPTTESTDAAAPTTESVESTQSAASGEALEPRRPRRERRGASRGTGAPSSSDSESD